MKAKQRVWKKVNGVMFSDVEIELNAWSRFAHDLEGYECEVLRRARFMLPPDIAICTTSISDNYRNRVPLDTASLDVKYDSFRYNVRRED